MQLGIKMFFAVNKHFNKNVVKVPMIKERFQNRVLAAMKAFIVYCSLKETDGRI